MTAYYPFGTNMRARHIGVGADGIDRWGYKSASVDDDPDMNAATEYKIEILLPDDYPNSLDRYTMLYTGTVNTEDNSTRGNALAVAKDANIHNDYQLVIVSNTWKSMPWYGTKNDGTRRYDTHIRWNIIPLIDQEYRTVATREGRLFMGFSKSGWGAISMMLTGPQYFGYAAAWDAPWEMSFGQWGSGDAFGTEARFNKYDPKVILPSKAVGISDKARIWISAGSTFPEDHAPMIDRLTALGVPHEARYVEVPQHEWNADWMLAGVQSMFEMRSA